MNNKPFFSIAIPTYNRAGFLQATIAIILEQTYKNYEIIIVDNASTDNTREVVKTFVDKRIKYTRNKENIGFPKNARKAMLLAKGEYILTMGDDDFILFNDTLSQVKKILDKGKYGFLKINMLERNVYGSGLQKKIMNMNRDIKINKNSSRNKVLSFCRRVDIGSIAGLVFKNENIKDTKFLISEVDPWFNLVVNNINKHGAYFLANRYVVITWPAVHKHQASHDVVNNQLSYESFNNELFKLVPKNQEANYKKKYYHMLVGFLPATKLYTSNTNLIKFAKRMMELEPSLRYSIKMWGIFLLALIIPKSIWLIVRRFYHYTQNSINKIQNLKMAQERYQFITSRYYIFANK